MLQVIKDIEAEQISDFKGLNTRNPWLALLMMITLFSMAGVPPTLGFFAKLSVLNALVNANLIWLAALALIFSVIGAYYYIAVIKVMYFEKPDDQSALPTLPLDSRIALSLNGLSLLALGIFPAALMQLCQSVL